jgi:signal transduction histidine kinase
MLATRHTRSSKQRCLVGRNYSIMRPWPLRSPLQTISLGIDLALEDIRTKGTSVDIHGIEEIIDQIKISSEIATSSLNDLLLFEKIQCHSMMVELQSTEIWAFIGHVMRPFYIQARAAGINLALSMDDSYDRHSTYCKIDPVKMQLVMRNLISNALKFSDRGSTVSVMLSIVADFAKSPHVDSFQYISNFPVGYRVVRISVKDSGPGISKVTCDYL